MSGQITERDLELADRANLCGASDFTPGATPQRMARQQHLAYEQAQLLRPVVQAAIQEREAAAPAKLTPRFFQAFAGSVIIDTTTNQPWWGFSYCCGVYLASGAERAHRAIIERDHLEALRRNDWMDRQRLAFEVTHEGRLALVGLV